jgi:hypothetical protein
MARASYCYIVTQSDSSKPVGAFTVKYEMLKWLDVMQKLRGFGEWRVWRCPDKPDTIEESFYLGPAYSLLEE